MLYLDYSDSEVKVGATSNPRKIPFHSSEELVRLLSPIIHGQKVAIIVPESDIFVNRARLITPNTNKSEVIRLIMESCPLKEDEIIFSATYIPQTKEILTYTMNKEIVGTYLDLMKSCKAHPDSLIPQSALVYETIRKKLTIDETVLYVDIGLLSSEILVLDMYGPVCTFEEDINEKNIVAQLPKIISFIKNKYERQISRLILSGGGVHRLHGEPGEFPLPTSLSSDYLATPKDYKEDELSYFNLLALEKNQRPLQQVNMLQNQPKESGSFIQQNMLGIIGIVIFLCTLFFIINKEIQLRSAKIASPVATPSSASQPPTSTPTPQITLSDLSFEVQNGSGIEGQAGKVSDILKKNNITHITTKNADNYKYVKTIIRIKKEYASFGTEIELIIKPLFALDKTEVLDSSASASVQIIVGK